MVAYRTFSQLDGRSIRDVAERRLAGTYNGQRPVFISASYTAWAQCSLEGGGLSTVTALLEGVLTGREGVVVGSGPVGRGRFL